VEVEAVLIEVAVVVQVDLGRVLDLQYLVQQIIQ
jgi:hypothetical protein